jgi:hypothetical protein
MDDSGSSCLTAYQEWVPLDEEPDHTLRYGQWSIASMSLSLL